MLEYNHRQHNFVTLYLIHYVLCLYTTIHQHAPVHTRELLSELFTCILGYQGLANQRRERVPTTEGGVSPREHFVNIAYMHLYRNWLKCSVMDTRGNRVTEKKILN